MNREERRKAEKILKQRQRRERYKMKKYDVTDKLSFEVNPIVVLKGEEFEIQADAKNIIEMITKAEGEDDFTGLLIAYEHLFSERDRKKIDKVKMNGKDFGTFVRACIALAIGRDPDEKDEEDETEGNE